MVPIALVAGIGVDWTGCSTGLGWAVADAGGDWSGCGVCSESDDGDESEDERGELHDCGLSGNVLIESCVSGCRCV